VRLPSASLAIVPLTPDQTELAHNWYGYGRWNAPYWFVGIEPGGDELDACVHMWRTLGKT